MAKRALVISSDAGLGAALVRELRSRGYEVLTLESGSRRGKTRRMHNDAMAANHHLDCDLSSRAELDRVLPEVIDHGPFDVVVLNAGASATGQFEKIGLAAHLKLLRLNTEAPMVIAAALLQADALNAGAAMLFVSSLSHFTGYPGAAVQAASSDALAVYAKSMRKAAKARGVSITVAFPGALHTGSAGRLAPRGAEGSKRMDSDEGARRIMADVYSGRKTSIPGLSNRAVSWIGKIAPKPVTALMRQLIYLRLEKQWSARR